MTFLAKCRLSPPAASANKATPRRKSLLPLVLSDAPRLLSRACPLPTDRQPTKSGEPMSVTVSTEPTTTAPRRSPKASLAARGCPNCGSARLRTAPAAMRSPVVYWFTGKKRYGCADCQWRGWKKPLARRSKAKPRRILHRPISPGTSALVIVASIISIALVSLQTACNPRQDTNAPGPVSVTRNPW